MKYFSPLKTKDILSLTGLIVLTFFWIMIDQVFLEESGQRFMALIILVIILFYLQLVINKPDNIWYYTNSVASISLAFSLTISVILHVIINHDFSFKSALISVIVAAIPYLAGLVYLLTRRKKNNL